MRDISAAEIDSIIAARPFTSLEDLWRRVEVSRPVLDNLVRVGALDSIARGRSRRELLWRSAVLGGEASRPVLKPESCVQLALDLDEPVAHGLPELPDYTPLEETEAELAIAGIDFRRHLMELYRPLVAGLGCTEAVRLGSRRSNSEVWVAGVKVASQTPAIRSGQRIIFVTLDDLTGPIDVTVFERAQPRCAHTVFHSWLLLIKGVVRKRGGASLRGYVTDPDNVGITVVVEEAFDLARVAADHSAGMTLEHCLEAQRTLQASAAAGRAPAHEAARAPAKLWHASGGSAGR